MLCMRLPGEKWRARKHGVQGRRQWRKVHLAMDTATSDIRAVEFTPSREGDSPVLPDLLGQIPEDEDIGTVTAPSRQHPSDAPAGQWMAPAIPAAATAPSSHVAARQSYRSEGTVGLGKRTARLPRRATKPCAPRVTTVGHSGSGGPDTTPAAAWSPRCDA